VRCVFELDRAAVVALLLCRYVAIGSKTVQGKSWLGGTVQDFAYQSYNICIGDGSAWGDGVTPLECALGEQGHLPCATTGQTHTSCLTARLSSVCAILLSFHRILAAHAFSTLHPAVLPPVCIACAALDGAHHIVMEGAKHVPLEAKPEQGVHWYGSGPYLEQWVDFLQHGSGLEAATEAAALSSSSV
jgi:hypothetical protein